MARISVRTIERASACPEPAWSNGSRETRCYFAGDRDPVHLHLDRVGPGDTMRIADRLLDRLTYVWKGEVVAGGRKLERGSSFIVEHGAQLDIVGSGEEALLLTFSAGTPPSDPKEGGHVRLLPASLVPRVPGQNGTSGGLHASGAGETSALWLNENSLSGDMASMPKEDLDKGIHAHPTDEIIFVTEGDIRLGARLFPSGTAIAIAADTLYGFAPGPDGVSFITFRPSGTNAIRFASGEGFSESSYFEEAGRRLEYLSSIDSESKSNSELSQAARLAGEIDRPVS